MEGLYFFYMFMLQLFRVRFTNVKELQIYTNERVLSIAGFRNAIVLKKFTSNNQSIY